MSGAAFAKRWIIVFRALESLCVKISGDKSFRHFTVARDAAASQGSLSAIAKDTDIDVNRNADDPVPGSGPAACRGVASAPTIGDHQMRVVLLACIKRGIMWPLWASLCAA